MTNGSLISAFDFPLAAKHPPQAESSKNRSTAAFVQFVKESTFDISLSDTIALEALAVALYTLIMTALVAIIIYELQRGDAVEDQNNKVAFALTATRLSLESALTGLILCAPSLRRKGRRLQLE